MARFFIHRPVLAWVIAIYAVAAGVVLIGFGVRLRRRQDAAAAKPLVPEDERR